MATIKIDELITVLTLKTGKGSERAFKNVKSSIFNIRRAALVAGTALAGLGVSLSVAKVAKSVDAQAKFAAGIGISFENLQKLQFAAQKAGATTGELDSFLGNLARTMRSTRPGEFNRTLLQMGVRAKTVQEAVVGLAGAFSKLSTPARRQQFGGQLGASLNIVNFLSQGQKKIAEDIQQALDIGAVVPGKLTAAAAALNSDALLKLKATTKGLADTIVLSLTPAISAMLNELDKWIVDNKELITSGIGGSLKAIGDSIIFIGKAAKIASDAIGLLVDVIGKVKPLSARINPFTNLISKDLQQLGRQGVQQATDVYSKIPIKEAVQKFIKRLPDASVSVPSAVSNSTANNANSNVNNVFNINVNGTDSPQETARQVVKEFELATALQAAHPGFNRTKVG